MRKLRWTGLAITTLLLALHPGAACAQQPSRAEFPTEPGSILALGRDQKEAIKVADSIYLALGFGNCYMVTTPEGNVIIDTSLPVHAPRQKGLMKAANAGPVKYIILTHGHGDHTGGVGLWKEPGTQVIAQRNYVEFMHIQTRLAGFFALRNTAQFGGGMPRASTEAKSPGNYAGKIEATILFDEHYEFELGGVKFELFHTPGETYDHLSVWIPSMKALFTGDNYYSSFPNIYTLRGTQPRWALDYVNSLNKALELKPEFLLPSHGLPVEGAEKISKTVTRYRDAILYVHDATVRGMNEGKDVFTLMREIKLPPDLDVGEGYGKLTWSVRGIYEGYAGWFDGNPSTMYEIPQSAVSADLVGMAGGAGAVAEKAKALLAKGEPVQALHMADAALAAEPKHQGALKVRLAALESLAAASKNSNELGWLRYGISETKKRMTPEPNPQ